jgi:hypothetical protein
MTFNGLLTGQQREIAETELRVGLSMGAKVLIFHIVCIDFQWFIAGTAARDRRN